MATDATNDAPTPAQRSSLTGSLWILGAVLLWSSSGLFAKAPIFEEWPAATRGSLLAFWRALFAGLLILPAVRRPRWNPHLIPMTACFALMNVTFLTAMTLTTAANTIWLQSTAPLWVFVFAVLFLGEPVRRRNVIALVTGLVGIGIILQAEIQGQNVNGVVLGLTSGLGYAGVVIFLRQLRDENGPWLIVLNHLVAALSLLPFVIYRNEWPSVPQFLMLAAFGFFQMGLPYVLFARGLRHLHSQDASLIGLVEPLLVPVWVFLAIKEVPATWTIAGGGFILLGLVIRVVTARRPT